MPTPQIGNPGLAFDSAGQDTTPEAGKLTTYAVSGGTIVQNTAVYFTYSSATGIISATAATAGQAASAGGFAMATVSTVGEIVEVCINGLLQVKAGASIAAGAAFSIGASGWAAAASTVIGSNWGIAIQAMSSSSVSTWWAQIARM